MTGLQRRCPMQRCLVSTFDQIAAEAEAPSAGDQAMNQMFGDLKIDEMALEESELQRRKQWLRLTHEDEERLREINEIAVDYADEVIDALYAHFMEFDEAKAFFQKPGTLKRVKQLQKQYFLRLTSGNYDRKYVNDRLKIGAVHERIGLDVKWYLGAYAFYMREVGIRLLEHFSDNPSRAFECMSSLKKLVYLDIGLALDTYIYRKESTIREQQDAIRELSTPVLQIRDRLLILPIVGLIDSMRALQLTQQLLDAIRAKRARVVIIDITGVPDVDSKVANHLIQTVEASRLMGCSVIVSGLSAGVAQTLVFLGLDIGKLNTVGDLQSALEEADRILGYRMVPVDELEERG